VGHTYIESRPLPGEDLVAAILLAAVVLSLLLVALA
jgi:hypothetical protein